MIEITRRLEFDAGHRILNHESKCKFMHGHRYVIEATVTSTGLDDLGRVIDFGVVKNILGTWIDENWDHNFLFHPSDPMLHLLPEEIGIDTIVGRKPYIFPEDTNPTAENMAIHFAELARTLLPAYLTVTRIVVHETPNCKATWSKPASS